ncbi:phosphotransferase family protein [Embleya sp. AB8]|uniref:phosphotransferase family protein n=1 Tax=Embleya sp. AB8 TaxID=3156304 RepID=UPI003C75B2C1
MPPDRPLRVDPGNSAGADRESEPVPTDTTPRRYTWTELPAELRAAIEQAAGRVTAVETPTDAYTSSFAAVLSTDRGRPVFVKLANRVDNARSAVSQAQEKVAAMLGCGPAAHLLDVLCVGTWSGLLYTVVSGRSANYAPGSPDLPLVAAALRRVNAIRPAAGTRLPTLVDRMARYLTPRDRSLLRGDSLLHHDLSPGNVRMHNGEVVLLDWGRATIGPQWVEGAGLYMWLREAGHSADSARQWVIESCPSWFAGSLAARRALLRAARAENVRPAAEFDMWAELLDPLEAGRRGANA